MDPGRAGSKFKIQGLLLDLKNSAVAVWILQAFDSLHTRIRNADLKKIEEYRTYYMLHRIGVVFA